MTAAGPTDDMKQAAGSFAEAIESANARLRGVNSEMAMLQASWRGDAAVRFGQAMNDWEQEYDVILSRLSRLLEVTGGPEPDPGTPWTGGLSGI